MSSDQTLPGYCSRSELNEYAEWIYSQACELMTSLEYQLGANHLLSEAKAIVLAGVFLNNNSLYNIGKKLLIDEAQEQFYPDGGHYEHSLSYHVESLQQIFEAFGVMRCAGKDTGEITELMREPYRFLNGLIGVNGKIPLFNDAAYDYPFYDAADFLATSDYIFTYPPKGKSGNYTKRWAWLDKNRKEIDWTTKVFYENIGYIHYQFESGNQKYSFFMDCGNNGPDYNLGHTHADALSVLLYSEEKEILVDSGVFTYQPGEERNFCRSTKAHNTVELDGLNSAEVWSAFRVARRGHTKIIDFSVDDGLKVKAAHDGYKAVMKDPAFHIRDVNISKGTIEINDVIESALQHRAQRQGGCYCLPHCSSPSPL